MGDNLLECYNPLYDVHLRQYFALPHMQKHLRNLGLLDGNQSAADNNNELHAGHLQMMDLMLRNRERVLAQLMDLQRKLDAAEKVELYRRIRSGMTNTEELDRSHLSRSLSRPARSAARSGRDTGEGRTRRQSLSPEAGEMIKRVETDYRSDSAPFKNPKSIYNRLAANVYKYQYLHKLDDRTLHKYMNSLRKQLAKLERFREVSFGPHTMARHQPSQLQQSWFFRRRSLPSLEAAGANHHHPPSQNQPQANAGRRSIKSGLGRKSRSGKSQSPQRAGAFEGPPSKLQRTSVSRTRGTQRLPPLPQSAPTKKLAPRTFTQRTTPTQQFGKGEARLPPTAVIRPTRKVQEQPPRRNVPVSAGAKIPAGKKTPQENRPASKGSTTPVPVQKPPSAGSGVLPAIGAALAGAAVGAGIAAAASAIGGEEENRESGAPSPSISLAASQTTTTDGGQPGGDSEWEGEQNGGQGEEEEAKGGTETRPTPEPFLEAKMEEGKEEIPMDEEEEEPEGQHTARPSIHSQIQSPEEEQPPEEPEPPKMHYEEEEGRNEEIHENEDEEEEKNVEQREREAIEHEEMTNLESAPLAAAEVNQEEEPEEPIARMPEEEEERARTNAEQEESTYPDEINSIEKETPEEVHKIEAEIEQQQQQIEENEEPAQNVGQEKEFEEEPYTGRSKREVAFAEEEEMPKALNDESLNYYGKEEWSPRNEERVEEGDEEQMVGEANLPIAASLDAAESERIRQFSHPNLEQENGPEESVRSLASSSIGGSFQREEESRPKSEEENHFGGEEEEAKFEQNEQPIEPEMEENEGHEFGNEPTSPMHPEEAVAVIQQQGEEKEIEEKHWKESEQMPSQETEKEEDAIEGHHVQTPVQIEITPSPENRNWDEEGEREYGGEEKSEGMPESEVEKMEHERDINGNEMGGEEIEGGREESSMDAPQLSSEPPATETEYLQEENETDESQNKTPREYEKEEEMEMQGNEQENEMQEGNTFEEQHDVGEEFGGGKEGLEQELDEKTFEVPEQFGGGQEEEMPKMEEAPNEEIEDKFERVKREVSPIENPQEQQNVVDLVENESVDADEDGAGRKLSGMDAQLGLDGEGMEEIGKAEARDGTEIGQSTADELVENTPLMDEEEQKGPIPEAFDGNMGSKENAEPVNEFEERNEEGGSHEVRHSEDPTMPIEDSMNETPREEFRGTHEEDGIISETGQSIEEGNAEEMGDTQFEGENEHQIESTPENKRQYANQQDGNDESTAPVGAPSEQHDEIRSRPETAESTLQQQRNSLLPSQPSIEITPASEYGGSVEDYGEMNSIQSSQPNSPIQPKEGENGEEMAAESAEHEETQKQNEINLIEFGSSSPIAQEEFGKTDETEETGQHHQNGHREEEEQNEQTPLIIEGGEHHQQGMMTKGIMDHGHGNGHLLSGEGGNGRDSAASSAETEGADEEGSEAEGSVVIHSGAAGGDQQHFQSVKLEDDDLIAKE